MEVIKLEDSLSLEIIKQHLQVEDDFKDDDNLIAVYAKSSLAYAENYTGKSWADWDLAEDFADWDTPIFLGWSQKVKKANIEYDNTDFGVSTVEVEVGLHNAIYEDAPDDYLGGPIKVSYSPYIDIHQQDVANQARLLMIGDNYANREDTITGTMVNVLPNGVKLLLDTIMAGDI